MRRWLVPVLALCLAVPPPALGAELEKQLLGVVRGFYLWALKNGTQTRKLEPQIRNVSGTSQFYLDTSTLGPFTEQFMKSGYFAPTFPDAVTRYYTRYETDFAVLSQRAFDEMARDGRGPLMETEDMDIFFCAQEYRYDRKFIDATKVESIAVDAGNATLVVQSPLHWKTDFRFVQIDGHWLIAGYCVYQ